MTLSMQQFRIRNTTIEQVRPQVEAYGREMAQRAKEQVTFSLAYQFAHALDRATLLHFQDQPMNVPPLEELWSHFQRRSAPPSPSRDYSARFSLFEVNGDVLGSIEVDRTGWRGDWMAKENVERYGTMLNTDFDPKEEQRRISAWSNATYGVEIIAFDGAVERPSLEEVHAQLPKLRSRAISVAGDVFENLVRGRFLKPGHTPEEYVSSSIKINEYLDTPEGEAELADLQQKMEGILLPEITIEMLEHGIHQSPTMRLS